MAHVLLLFIDGIGLGQNNPKHNPFAATQTTLGSGTPLYFPLNPSKNAAIVVPTDAGLGISGLPQSATGQSTILSGVNAAALLGHHLPAYPNKRLAQLLAEKGIFTWCREQGFSATFANGFRREYWDMVANGKWRHSATTLSVLGAQGYFRDEKDFEKGAAVYHDITGWSLRHSGKKVPSISVQEAGKRIAQIVKKNHFTLFEYFLTDMAGHRRQWDLTEKSSKLPWSLVRITVVCSGLISRRIL